MKKKILILTHSPLNSGPRPLRQIKLLKGKYEIHTVGTIPSGEEDVFFEFKKIKFIYKILKVILLKLSLYKSFYWDGKKTHLVNLLKPNNYDLIIAHDEDTLPIAFGIKSPNTKIILDAHELFPFESTHLFLWRFFYQKYINWMCAKFIPKVDSFFTVSKNIATKYYELYGVKSEIVTNAGDYSKIEPSIVKYPINIVHHGACFSGRKIELMIQMMDFLDDNFKLTLFLTSSQSKRSYFKMISKMASSRKNVIIKDPVPFSDIIPTLNQFDIGLFLLPPTNLSYDLALPNKFFEYVQAKLAIAIGPSTEMKEIVKKYDLGVVSRDFHPQSLAEEIKKLTFEKITYYKDRSKEFAPILSSEPNLEIIEQVVTKLIEQPMK